MKDNFWDSDYEEYRARKKAREFEQRLKDQGNLFLDLMQIDEIYNYYLLSNELVKAQELVTLAIQTYPSNADLYYKQARLDFEYGRYYHAVANIDTALEFSPGMAEYVLFKSDVLARLDKYAEAISLLENLLARCAGSEEIYLQMGNVAQICSFPEESEKFYRQALSIKPGYEEALFELAFLLESEDKSEAGILLYESFLDNYPYSAEVWLNLANLYRKTGNYEKALEACDFATIVKEDFTLAWFNRGQILADLGKFTQALQSFLQADSISPGDIHTLYRIAECYEQTHHFREAYRYFLRVSKHDPYYIDAWMGMGYCMEKLEKYREAIHFYEKACKLDEENSHICFCLAICEYKLEERYKAFNYLQKALRLAPQEILLWQDWAQLLYRDGNFAGAVVYLEEGIKQNPLSAELYYQCAAYCYESGKRKQGISLLKSALRLSYEGHYLLYQIDSSLAFEPEIQAVIASFR
ncbi:MAG: tetratricopeptide repeat protein [Bacteroidia bacterium]|nr:tetratricopeptide repeat protein [Bacteroidia bacterium]